MLNSCLSRFIHSLHVHLSRANASIIIDAKWKEEFEESMLIRESDRAHSRFSFLPPTSFCRVFRSDSRFALPPPTATVLSFFSRLLLYYRSPSPQLRGTLTRTLGRQVIRRGTCWRKQSSRVNTESDERVIVNWENRVRSLVISIASDCRYLLSRRYFRGQPIYFRHQTFNFEKDDHRASACNSRDLWFVFRVCHIY